MYIKESRGRRVKRERERERGIHRVVILVVTSTLTLRCGVCIGVLLLLNSTILILIIVTGLVVILYSQLVTVFFSYQKSMSNMWKEGRGMDILRNIGFRQVLDLVVLILGWCRCRCCSCYCPDLHSNLSRGFHSCFDYAVS